MIDIETFQRGASPRTRPTAPAAVIRIEYIMIRSDSLRHPVLHFCCVGSRPAMTMLTLAPPSTTALSINQQRATLILPVAIGRTAWSLP